MAMRWAFMERKQLGRDGYLFLRRLQVIRTPWLGIYMHDILGPDADADPHDHPWFLLSMIVSRQGWYLENLYEPAAGQRHLVSTRLHRAWRPRWITRSHAHAITDTPGSAWNEARPVRTLAITGPARSSWSFWLSDGTRQPWDDYLRERGQL